MLVSSTGGLIFVFNRNIAFLVLVICIMLSLFYIGRRPKKSVYYSSILVFFSLSFIFIINLFFANSSQSLARYAFFGITIFTTVLALFYFNNQDNKYAFISSLYFVLKLVLFHSLFSFAAYHFVKDNLYLIDSQYHSSETYKYLFYYSVKSGSLINLFGLDIQRSAGIFWEPGILQAYLNILFFLEVSIYKRSRVLLLFIVFGILLTYSTTGLILLLFQIIYFLQKKFRKHIALALIAIIGIPLYILVSANITEKVFGEGELSFQKRLIDLTQPFFIALENPISGVGLDLEGLQEIRDSYYINSNLNVMLGAVGVEQKLSTTSKAGTNSVMSLLASMGFPTTLLFIFMFFNQQILTKHRFVWFVITFASVMSEPLILKPFFFMFIISGFSHFFLKFINKKREVS